MKRIYQQPDMEVLLLELRDVITLSDGTGKPEGEGSDIIPLGEGW